MGIRHELFMPEFVTELINNIKSRTKQKERGKGKVILMLVEKVMKTLFRSTVIGIKTITTGERDWVQL